MAETPPIFITMDVNMPDSPPILITMNVNMPGTPQIFIVGFVYSQPISMIIVLNMTIVTIVLILAVKKFL